MKTKKEREIEIFLTGVAVGVFLTGLGLLIISLI